MKFFPILLCSIIIIGSANATTTIKSNPDKPSEIITATVSGSAVYYYSGVTTTTTSWNWKNTIGGNYFSVMLPDGEQDGLNIYWEDYYSWGTNGLGPFEIWKVIYRGGNPPDRELYDSGTNSYSSFPLEIGSLSEAYDPPWGFVSRNSKVTIQLKTGGKSGSKLKNLFGLTAGATGYKHLHLPDDDIVVPHPSDSYSIPATSIEVAGGHLNTNGIAYRIFPDNATVDVTPKTLEKYYSVNVSAIKYKSYFDLFIQQANPGYSLIPFGSYDVGHAFWRLRTEAPSDALQYISTNITVFLNKPWGFYPTNEPELSVWNLATVPGLVQDDSSHEHNIKRIFAIGFPGLISGLQFTREIYNSPPLWSATGYSCVGAAREAGYRSGVYPLPWDTTPQNFGVTLVQMYPGPFECDEIFYPPSIFIF